MKSKSLRGAFVKTTLVLAAIILTAPSLLLFSFRSKLETYTDIWQQLGLTQRDGTDNIRESFLSGYLQYGGARSFRNIALGDRKAVTIDLLNYTKKYLETSDFKKAYEFTKQNNKPREVTSKPRTEDQIRQDLIKGTKEGMDNMEKSLKTATGDMKKVFQDTYEMYKQQLAEYQKPDNQMIPLMAQGEQSQHEAELKAYDESMKKWEKNYPAEASQFVKLRLQKVLAITEGIDYSAALTERNGKKYFVKQEYERKPSYWKAGFRAGKEVTETVRTFVQQWLQEL